MNKREDVVRTKPLNFQKKKIFLNPFKKYNKLFQRQKGASMEAQPKQTIKLIFRK